MAEGEASAQVQPGDEIREAVGAAIPVRVLADRDPVGALGPFGWWFGDLRINGPRPAVHLHALESGGRRVLQVLHGPEPAAVVELDKDRLADIWLARVEGHGQAVSGDHSGSGHVRSIALRHRLRRQKSEGEGQAGC